MKSVLEHMRNCPRRWWYAAGALTIIAVVIGATLLISAYVDGREKTDKAIVAQALKNQHHTDCSITFALGNDPPACADVKADLARVGIPLTPNQSAAQADPRKSPAVAYLACLVAKANGLPPPEGVPCPPDLGGTS